MHHLLQVSKAHKCQKQQIIRVANLIRLYWAILYWPATTVPSIAVLALGSGQLRLVLFLLLLGCGDQNVAGDGGDVVSRGWRQTVVGGAIVAACLNFQGSLVVAVHCKKRRAQFNILFKNACEKPLWGREYATCGTSTSRQLPNVAVMLQNSSTPQHAWLFS